MIVGVDPGNRKIGVTVEGVSRTVTIPPIEKGATGTDRARRLAQIRRAVLDLTPRRPDSIRFTIWGVAVVEGYSLGGRRGYAASYGGEAGGVIREALFEVGFEIVDVPPSRLKRYATGDGSAKKPAMIAAAYAETGQRLEENAADAFWLWKLADHGLEGNAPTGLESIRAEILDAIVWPREAVSHAHRAPPRVARDTH